MKRNIGLPDRIIRVLLATIAPVLYVSGLINGVVAIILFVVTVLLLVTSLIKFCPLYKLLGINTERKIKI